MAQETVSVRFLRGTCLGGGVDAYPGDVVDIPCAQARLFVAQGRAVLAEAVPAPYTPESFEAPGPVIEHRDPAPVRATRRRR